MFDLHAPDRGRVLLGLLIISLATAPVAAQNVTVCMPTFFMDALADLGEEHENLRLAGVDDDLDPSDCDGLIAGYRGIENFLVADSKLRWIQSNSAGVEGFLAIPDLRDSDIVLTNAKIIQGPEIADHAFALLLNFTRNIKAFNARMPEGWNTTRELPMIELRGKTALVIGLGGIGTQIAQRAAAFGMTVIAVDPKDIPIHRDVAYVGKPDELDDLLPRADVVFSSVPHTPATEGLIGERQFELMKQDVYFINISRGKIVDTDALVAALESGKVRAAGLDVTDPEPLPTGHPLWTMSNVTITPHLATISDRLEERRMQLLRDNITRFATGRPLRNIIDKQVGY